MFAVTGKLLVKPRVRCPPQVLLPQPGGFTVPRAACSAIPGRGCHSPPHRPLTGSSPTPAPGRPGRAAELHEARGSRRVPQDFCWWVPSMAAAWAGGAQGGPGARLHPHEPLGISSLAGKASCWLNLNVELLREQLFAIRSKRRKLGEEPGGGRAQDAWVPSSLALGALVPWEPAPHGGSGAMKWGEVGNPGPGTSGPLSISCPGVGARAPLSPAHVPPAPELRHRASPWQRNLGYPLAMLGLLALTVSGPGGPGACPRLPPSCPHSLPAPPRASLCSSSASTSWSCCWTMPRCHGASRYRGGGTQDSEDSCPTLAW